tara:strand:+ start:68 stop:1081 length:1014 start_codon:yes stop_codon:yes gene_type:complete
MKSFYSCNLFALDKTDGTFVSTQEELNFNKQNDSKLHFSKITVEYKIAMELSNLKEGKDTIIIPTRNGKDILNHVLKKMTSFDLQNKYNIILIDDRSKEDIKSISKKYHTSYIRVDNDRGFNFSMLNNIGFYACRNKNIKNVIMWNNDVWPDNPDTLDALIHLHNKNSCTISGTKLLYPKEKIENVEFTENIKHYFPHKFFSFKDKVQFGNGDYVFMGNNYVPHHIKRFSNKNSNFVNYNGPSRFITGAFQIIDLNWVLSCGGLNPSLPENFQDCDLCLRALEEDKKVFYFGKDLFLYHAESVTLLEIKKQQKFSKDSLLFNKIWDTNRKYKIFFGE